MTTSVIIGGSGGLGQAIAVRLADRVDEVIVTSRDQARADAVARRIGPTARGLSVDLSQPDAIAADLADVPGVDDLVITGVEQGANSLREKERPYPGSTFVTASNGGISGLVKTLAVEIAPHRVNAVHPGVVGDSPKWRDTPHHPHVLRTPIGRLVTVAEVVDATESLLRNTGVNAHDLFVDGGLLVT
ncbi:SDR family NAD(P)-dependent oxidoreductase [Frankia sp. QA3]|uniref:SDR family NAD(P)-dependent oxidoreductase n=1 Tax=Frankia sp. QA3 TaxID=710111 RepID=UPI000269C128|nr:SDR family oxidoreductase [Frankia sp. QA3]EIV92898.1 dehydrogenase of unknown specificity [Frankia sp. QA3]